MLSCIAAACTAAFPAFQLRTRPETAATSTPVRTQTARIPRSTILRFRRSCFIFRAFLARISRISRSESGRPALRSGPVSYTHLDVYKRQALISS